MRALANVEAKLDWALKHHADMVRLFKEFAMPHGRDARPHGIEFRPASRPSNLVVAKFRAEARLPVEMALRAADLVHNARSALDQAVAGLKAHFGGDPTSGGFPVCVDAEAWQRRITKGGRSNPLRNLAPPAVELVYRHQPLHSPDAGSHPLAILNSLDNKDKHQLLLPAFTYPAAEAGLDLIEVVDKRLLLHAENVWRRGQPLEHGTTLARFLIRGQPARVLRANETATLGYATGDVSAGHTSYVEMIDAARSFAEEADALIQRESGSSRR